MPDQSFLSPALKHVCWLHTQRTVGRYLLSNADGRWDGAEKAMRHMELCQFYVALVRGVEVDEARMQFEDDYQAVHTKTQELTSHLDTAIGFPIKGRPDYPELEPKFFSMFHALAMQALGQE